VVVLPQRRMIRPQLHPPEGSASVLPPKQTMTRPQLHRLVHPLRLGAQLLLLPLPQPRPLSRRRTMHPNRPWPLDQLPLNLPLLVPPLPSAVARHLLVLLLNRLVEGCKILGLPRRRDLWGTMTLLVQLLSRLQELLASAQHRHQHLRHLSKAGLAASARPPPPQQPHPRLLPHRPLPLARPLPPLLLRRSPLVLSQHRPFRSVEVPTKHLPLLLRPPEELRLALAPPLRSSRLQPRPLRPLRSAVRPPIARRVLVPSPLSLDLAMPRHLNRLRHRQRQHLVHRRLQRCSQVPSAPLQPPLVGLVPRQFPVLLQAPLVPTPLLPVSALVPAVPLDKARLVVVES